MADGSALVMDIEGIMETAAKHALLTRGISMFVLCSVAGWVVQF